MCMFPKVDLLEIDASNDSKENKKKKKKKSEELEREREFNEVYPKERASKHGANSSSASSSFGSSAAIFLICSLVLVLQIQV